MSAATGGVRRRDLLKGGALLVGFAVLPRVTLAESHGPFAVPDLTGPAPDPKQVDSWLRVGADGLVTLLYGKCDIGQGGFLAIAQVAAEELDVGLDQVRTVRMESDVTPDQGETDASSTAQYAAPQVRAAAAEARLALLMLAAARLKATVPELIVKRGVVSVRNAPERNVPYAALIGSQRFNRTVSGTAPLKAVTDYTLVGTRAKRDDIAAKVSGRFDYIQTVRVPGMLHARVVRPRGQPGYGTVAPVLGVNEESIAHIAGARVVRKGNFLAVIAPREWDAVRAAQALKVQWGPVATMPGNEQLYEAMRTATSVDTIIDKAGDVERALSSAEYVSEGIYAGPYQSHGCFAPHCAVADVKADRATIMTATQGVYATRYEISRVIDLPMEAIKVIHYEASGTYGASTYTDVAQAAALTSQLSGKPVRLQFMRWDEFGWDNYGNAHVGKVRAAADSQGKITAFQYEGWQHGWTVIEPTEELAKGGPAPPAKSGPARVVNKLNIGAMYSIPNKLLVNHHIAAGDGFLRTSALRSPIDMPQSFAAEQTFDDLARRLNLDPAEFRKRNMTDPRWMAVLDEVLRASNWQPHVQASSIDTGPRLRGRGVGLGTHFASYGAVVADVEVQRETGQVKVTHLYGALEPGLVINPDIVESQMLGMLTQATSRMLHEEVLFSESAVTSLDWNSYPTLRFDERPEITAIVISRPDKPATGAGEELMAAAAAAIGSAVFDATGVRFKEFPLNRARVKAAL